MRSWSARTRGGSYADKAILQYLDADAPERFEERLRPYRAELRKEIAKRFSL